MSIIATNINARMYIEILDNSFFPSIENWFGDDELIQQDDNASSHRTKLSYLEKTYKINDMVSEH